MTDLEKIIDAWINEENYRGVFIPIKCQWCNNKKDFSDAQYGICFECGNCGPKAKEFLRLIQ